ncbi:cytochrome c oxidase assembly factor 4 homolog, mitochondrial [Phasianus colchicus]|uniref:cytochrome c oxidase assembly factor 4 homolog, mitochondrial n=1 Tax=Phasianus colchicus TaxID=9054 RepID=UPI00129DE3B6|nr:cytochrome c oxidase assembly factor 4 homolog, mitochondrial [Phasianus colchicus]
MRSVAAILTLHPLPLPPSSFPSALTRGGSGRSRRPPMSERFATSPRPGSVYAEVSLKGAAWSYGGTGVMAKPGHAWSRPKSQEEEEEDPVEAMVTRTGCAEQHWALQECMAEQRDWRRCQAQVQAFRQCMARQQRPHPEELHPNPSQHSPHGD